MGKLIHVSLRLDEADVAFLQDSIDRFFPFISGISEAGRLLIKVAQAAVLAGMVPWDLHNLQELLRGLRAQEAREDSAAPIADAKGGRGLKTASRHGLPRYFMGLSRRQTTATGYEAYGTSQSAVALGGRIA